MKNIKIKIERLEVWHINNFIVGCLNNLLQQLSPGARKTTIKDWERIIKTQGTTIFAAREQGNSRIMGMAMIHVWEIPTKKKGYIDDVVVDEKYRGMEIGKKLTLLLLEKAREEDATCVDLTSRPDKKPANMMYEKLGFKIRKTNYYRYNI